MDSIYATLDYRDYLKTYYAERKAAQRSFSYRVFAQALDMDQSQLAKILIGQLHLARESIPAITRYFQWSGSETAYFEALVNFGRATTSTETRLWYDRLQSLRPADCICLAAEQMEYFRHWYTPVIRALATIHPGVGADSLANWTRPTITKLQAKQSLETMLHLGLLAEPHVSSGKKTHSPLLRDYHRQCIALAQDSLENIAPDERDISSLVAGLDAKAMSDLRDMIREFRLSVQKRIDQVDHADRVVQINFQLFPVSQNTLS